jgi:L-alanine-DL-glutamate epimerase-like enolase superfamily enzyme
MKESVQRLRGLACDRRSFVKSFGIATAGASATSWLTAEDIEAAPRNVQRHSIPSQLKITDLRIAVITGAPMNVPLLRLDTNQGLVGYGEVRDGGSKNYALLLKSRLLGENPCHVDKLFRKIKQFGAPARQAGGVCGVEMALWDLAGKAYGVPAYQMLGGKFRDRVRLYADTTEGPASARPPGALPDGTEEGKRLKERMNRGITFLKQDFGIGLLRGIPGTLSMPAGADAAQNARVMHPFTGIEITDKGVEILANFVGQIRSVIGMEIPLSSDHYGHISVNSCIKLARAMEKHNLAWMEDMVPWQLPQLLKQIKDATTTPILTGEDIYLKEDFIKLIEMEAIDMIHPDLASSGGLLETKKIGDYAMEHGVPMAMHFAGSPISFRANVHCAAATENFLALEHHSLDVEWWEKMVKTKTPLVDKGFAPVPEEPGLGIDDLVPEVIKQHLHPDHPGYFEPTPEWDKDRVNDRLWS